MKMKSLFANQTAYRSTGVLLSTVGLFLMVPPKAAHAGDWRLHGYVHSANTRSENQTWARGEGLNYKITKTNPKKVFTPATEVRYSSGLSASANLSSDRSYGASAPTPQGWPIKAGVIYADFTVHAVFKWERNRLYNEQTDTFYDDPNDNPPKTLFIWEEAIAGSNRSHDNGGDWPGNIYSAGHPFTGDWMPVSGLKNGLGSPIEIVSGITGQSRTARGIRMIRVDTKGQDIVHCPDVTMGGRNPFTAKDFVYLEQANISLNFGYEARMVNFSLTSRRKDSDPSVHYSNQSTIIAGGKDNDQHKADIQLRLTAPDYWGSYEGIAGVTLAQVKSLGLRLKLSNEKGAKALDLSEDLQETDAEVNAIVLPPTNINSVTTGGGTIDFAIVKSKDLVVEQYWNYDPKSVPPVAAHLATTAKNGELNLLLPVTGTTIFHDWGSVEWRTGEDGEGYWPSMGFSDFDSEGKPAEYKEWIWAKLKNSNQPIKDHQMKFVANRLTVRIKNPHGVSPATISKTFTTSKEFFDYLEENKDDGEMIEYARNIDDLISPYVTLPAAEKVSDGVFKGQLTIKRSTDFIVESLVLDVQDQNVYKRKN